MTGRLFYRMADRGSAGSFLIGSAGGYSVHAYLSRDLVAELEQEVQHLKDDARQLNIDERGGDEHDRKIGPVFR